STTTPTWYPLPGYISNSDNEFRITFNHLPSNSNKTRLTIYRVSGNGAFTNAPVRILVTEAEVFRTISSKVDFGDYNDVKRYFQLGN
ncbi:MAG TPA: hypothetical protein VKZ95_02135, partial [Sphingobacteriaceae bacterium]|nr:hypothetical protein [Sphingobacteriaceae bacterium]